jgi:hypothetical protein
MAVVVLSICLLGGCAEEALPQRRTTPDDCLRSVEVTKLDEAIKRCDRVVASFPQEPLPLNERFLLHSLKGDNRAACSDIRRADALVRRLPAQQIDRLLRNDIKLRLASCKD